MRNVTQHRHRRTGAQPLLWMSLLWLVAVTACTGPLGPSREGVGPQSRTSAPPLRSEEDPRVTTAEFEFLRATELEREGNLEEALLAYEQVLVRDPDAEILPKMAELALKLNRLEDALSYAERAWEAGSENLELRLFLGARYAQLRDLDAVREVLRDEEGEPIGPEAAILLYSAEFSAGDYLAARNTATWLEDHEPEGLRGSLALAAALEALNEPDTAERILRAALQRHPGALPLYASLAELRRNRGDRIGELGIYREVLAYHPENIPTLMAKAEVELALGRHKEARETLLTVEQAHPEDLRATLRLAFLDYEDERWEEALKRFERAHAAFPDQGEIAFFLGVMRSRVGDQAGALAVFESIAPGQDRFADAQLQIAGMYEEKHDWLSALESIERALAEEPRRELQLYRATLLSRLGNRDSAIFYLEDLLEAQPGDVELLFHMGILYQEGGQEDVALDWMERVLEQDEGHPGALNFIGYALAERGEDLDQAEALISMALERRPNDGFIADSLGWVYYQRAQPLLARGHEEEARQWLLRAETELQRAAALSGGDPVISEHLGDVYRALGRKAEALTYYEDAVARGLRPAEQPELLDKLNTLREELARP